MNNATLSYANNMAVLRRLLLLLLLLLPNLLRAQTSRTILAPERVFYYPRVLRLAASGAANGRLIASFDNGNTGAIYQSTDDGQSWTSIGNITETTSGFNCCSGLYEVPRQLGGTAAGTLFWATSVAVDRARNIPSAIRIYRSLDQGPHLALLLDGRNRQRRPLGAGVYRG